MNPLNIVRIVGALGVVALIAFGGYRFGYYRAVAIETPPLHTRIDTLTTENTKLKLAVAQQNAAVEAAQAAADAADRARATAQRQAELLAGYSKSRMKKLDSALDDMKSCSEVLRRYWELRQ